MSMLGHVFDSLKAMSLLQLLLAFGACSGYAVAQGGLIGARGRQWAGMTALATAAAFTLLATDWMAATMLVAFAVAGLGVFVALAWVLSRWVAGAGRPGAGDAAEAADTAFGPTEPEPADGGFAPSRVPPGTPQSA